MQKSHTYMLLFLGLFFTTTVLGQGVDSLFMQARQFAFNGEREKAREICTQILLQSPEYSDVQILIGRTYSWDGKRDSARLAFNKVLAYDSANADAWSSLADVEFWDDKYEAFLAAAENGVRFNPGNTELMLKKAKALVELKRYSEAKKELQAIKQIDTLCVPCKQLSERIYREEAVNYFALGYQIDEHSETFGTFHWEYLQFGTKIKNNTFIFRFNINQRFGSDGYQPEIDYYPSIGKKMYLYLNYGFSRTDLFPNHRVGMELYRSLPKSFEVSAGYRYMNFGGSEVWIYTGSITKYMGNYAFIFRPFITPDKAVKSFSRSGILNIRKYTSDADNYYGITGSIGFSPDQRAFLTKFGLDSVTSSKDLYYIKSYRVGIAISKTVNFKHLWLLELDYRLQEKIGYNVGEFVNVYIGSITYKFRF